MDSYQTQQHFFQHIKEKLPLHISFVDAVAELLNISNDSAYRRIRGEKPLSFDELQLICTHYKVSMDSFMGIRNDSFVFNGRLKSNSSSSFEEWLNTILTPLELFNSYASKHVYFLLKDIPPYVHFLIPELARFKVYLWMKSILGHSSLKGVRFDLTDARYDAHETIFKKMAALYVQIPMTEIWNAESIDSTLRQIHFYQESGSFKNTADIQTLYDKVEELINHLEKQAELGLKFVPGREPNEKSGSYRVYVNELILGDNTVVAELDNSRITFLNYAVLQIIHTTDHRFNDAMAENISNLVSKSMLISQSGEKERLRFFHQLREKIDHYRALK